MADKRTAKIEDADALKIKRLVHDTVVNSTFCEYRHCRKVLGKNISDHCPHKFMLPKEWKQYLADEWNREFEEDNPNLFDK